MASPLFPIPKPITSFPDAAPVRSTDVYIAVDTTTVPRGTDRKYTMTQLQTFAWETISSVRPSGRVVAVDNQVGNYNNGASGIGATFTYTATGAIIIDGVSLILNDRVLIEGQDDNTQNGIYYVSIAGTTGVRGVLTRALDYNTPTLIQDGTVIFIYEGTIYSGTGWQETGDGPFIIGTTPIIFTSLTDTITGIVPLDKGGTNKDNTAVAGAVAWCDAVGIGLTAAGSSHQLLYSNGTLAPAWTTPAYPITSGILNTFLISDGINNIYSTYGLGLGGNISTEGSLTLSGNYPVIFNFAGPTNVTFPTTGTLATTAQLVNNVNVTVDSTQMVVNTSYTINNTLLATLTLPVLSAIGDVLEVTGNSLVGWLIAQNAGQNIQVGNTSSTVGAGGSVASSNQYDAIRIKCTVANTTWVMQSSVTSIFTIV